MSSEEFAKELLMYSTARAATALGYKTTSSTVLETLSDVMGHYMKTISEKMKDNSEIAGRAAPGMPDLLHALEIQNCNWRTLRDFAFEIKDDNNEYNINNNKRKVYTQKWDQPFFIDVPSFPVKRRQKDKNVIDKKGKEKLQSHIPSHLPLYPPRHTWSNDKSNKRNRDEKSNIGDDNKRKKVISSDTIKQSISLIEDAIDEKVLQKQNL
jgi:hypothetical protein